MRHLLPFAASLFLLACGPNTTLNSGPFVLPDMGEDDMATTTEDLGSEEPTIETISIEPNDPRVVVDTTLPLTATAFNADGAEVPTTFTWASSAPETVDVAPSGIVIGAAIGSAEVTASAGGVTGRVEVRVVPTPAAELIISPMQRQLFVDDTVQIAIELLDANGGLLDASDRETTYTSSDSTVVEVTQTGLVTAVSAGDASVVVAADGLEQTASFTVVDSELEAIRVTPTTTRLYPGETASFDVEFVWADEPGDDPSVTWTSSDETVATVDAGVVTAVAKGSATVTAEAAGRTATVSVDVVFDFGPVSTGGGHACAIVDGVAWCWGDNASGQLGHASNDAAPVETALRFRTVSAGGAHTCAIATDDTLYCWGNNDYGQLGYGSNPPSSSPVKVGTLGFSSVSAGAEHTCAITVGNRAYCWGRGADGRLGTGATNDELLPVLIGPYTTISAGERHTCATTNGVGGDCWGDNDTGQLGRNFSSDFEASPGPITGGYDFSEVTMGGSHGCGVTIATSAACWGTNTSGQVGDGTTTTRLTPILLPGSPQLTRLTTGSSHSCGLSAMGAAYCWGEGDDGRLGTGDTMDRSDTTAVVGGLLFSSVSGGDDFTCGTTIAGDPHCWGAGYGIRPVPIFP